MADSPFSTPPRYWQLRTRRLDFSTIPLLMGIVNITPDSFSDGGRFLTTSRAVEHALKLVEQGADVLDIGGESTRPYAPPVDGEEELRRIVPVVREVCRQTRVPVSIDTSKARVAREAIDLGAEIINDVTGLEGDREMLPLATSAAVAVCAMHMQGTPLTMQDHPTYGDVVAEIHQYLRARREALWRGGVTPDRICLDPGIGFGKTHRHNLDLLSHCDRFRELGCPLLVGHSRKGFIAHVIQDKQTDRTPGTIGVALSLALQGVHILRVHDISAVRQALRLFAATGGLAPRPPLT